VVVVIEGYIGRPGEGKTYTLVYRALKAHRRYETVYANFVVGVPNLQLLEGPEDLLEIGPGLVLIDEAHLWFPSRLSMKLPPSMLMKLSQTRKAGWDMWWTAQHESRVDRVLRDVTNWMHLSSAWFKRWNPAGDYPLFFTARTWEPERFRKAKKDVGWVIRPYLSRVASAYDTSETLKVAGHVAAQRDYYRKGS
jgi:hypothetical protein